MRKVFSWTYGVLAATSLLVFAGANIAGYFGAARLPVPSWLVAALVGFYLIGGVMWEIWPWRCRTSGDLPSSVTEALPPPGPEYYERPPPTETPSTKP